MLRDAHTLGRPQAQLSGLRGLRPVTQRRQWRAAAVEVHRELGGRNVLARRALCLERGSDIAMQLSARRRHRPFVERFPEDRVAKRVRFLRWILLGRRGEPALLAHELVARLGDPLRVASEQREPQSGCGMSRRRQRLPTTMPAARCRVGEVVLDDRREVLRKSDACDARRVADEATARCGPRDHVARYGGDE